MHCIMGQCVTQLNMSSLASAMLEEMLYSVKWWFIFPAENQMKVKIPKGRQEFGNPNIYRGDIRT